MLDDLELYQTEARKRGELLDEVGNAYQATRRELERRSDPQLRPEDLLRLEAALSENSAQLDDLQQHVRDIRGWIHTYGERGFLRRPRRP